MVVPFPFSGSWSIYRVQARELGGGEDKGRRGAGGTKGRNVVEDGPQSHGENRAREDTQEKQLNSQTLSLSK